MSKFLKEFKDFALKGNMIDMAVGIIMAFVVFCVVKQLNRLRRKPEEAAPAAPTEKECPFCRTSIAINATRCPHCTSMLGEPEGEAETPL